jgi:hypothetical protein
MSRPASRLRRSIGLAVALVSLALALPAGSSAESFGANLGRPADNTYACNSSIWTAPYANPYTSCSINSQNLSTGENAFPPSGEGVVTAVRVKVGPVTGPMQVVVEQALRQDNPGDPGHPIYACCQAINASQVFTPAPNGVTQIATNLPVRQDLAPDPSTGIYTDQHLSLSVLAPNVPIPANLDSGSVFGLHFPAWSVGEERAGVYGSQGLNVLLNADWAVKGSPAANAAANCPNAKQAQASKKKKKKKNPCAPKKKRKKRK